MGAAELGFAEFFGLGFAKSAEFTGAAVDDFSGKLRIERGGLGAWTRRVGKNVEVGERKRVDELESGFMVGFSFSGKTSDDVGSDGGVWEKFANEFCAASVMLRAIPAVHGSEDVVRTGLERHMEVLGDAIGTGEEGDEVLGEIKRLDGADAEARQISFVEDVAQEIENMGAGRKIAPPGAEIDSAEDDFLKTGVRETANLRENGFRREATAFTADVWNDAEGTAVVATILDFECGASMVSFPTEDGGDKDVPGREDVAS